MSALSPSELPPPASAPAPAPTAGPAPTFAFVRAPRLAPVPRPLVAAVIAVLALALVAAVFTGSAGVRRLRTEAAAERERVLEAAAREKAELLRGRANALKAQGAAVLRLSALPLAWSLRGDLPPRRFRELGASYQKLAKEPNVRRVVLISPDGLVKVASDPKLETRPGAEVFPGAPLTAEEPRVHFAADEVLAIVPVLAPGGRLGTIVLAHAPFDADAAK